MLLDAGVNVFHDMVSTDDSFNAWRLKPVHQRALVFSVIVRASPVIRVAKNQKRVEFPLVPSSNPGSIHLTNEMIGEILDQEDASS